MHLTATDERVLAALADAPAGVDAIATRIDEPPERVAERLSAMADNELVVEDGEYRLTDSGRRVLDAPGDGTADDRIDVPDDVRAAIEALDFRPDREDALLAAVAFVRYWGEASESELIDAVYSAHPAGFGDHREWQRGIVHGALDGVPGVSSDGNVWSWERADANDHRDGRNAPDDATAFASVKHAFETIDPSADVRSPAHDAFALLLDRGTARDDELRADLDASADENWWTERVTPVLAALPGVSRATIDGDPGWRYRPSVDGPSADRPQTRAETESSDRESIRPTADSSADECPVCGRPYAGRSFIATDATIVPARRGRTCVAATEKDRPGLTLYYHDGADPSD